MENEGLTQQEELRIAQKKIMNLLSRRNYSRLELKKKLHERFSPEVTRLALVWAEEQNWLPAEADIAARSAELLLRRNKGSHYIQNYLREKGLPPVEIDSAAELQRAMELVDSKWERQIQNILNPDPDTPALNSQERFLENKKLKDKICRFLLSRGFESQIVRKVLHEKFRN